MEIVSDPIVLILIGVLVVSVWYAAVSTKGIE